MQIVMSSGNGAGDLVWHRNGACLDDDRGEMRGGRGGLWEEVKRGVWGKRGSDLHDAKEEQGMSGAADVQAKVKSDYVTCVKSKKR